MCIRCNWTREEWILFIENEITKLPLTDEEKNHMLNQIRYTYSYKNKNFKGRTFIDCYDIELYFKAPKEWIKDKQIVWGGYLVDYNDLYDVELKDSIETNIISNLWSMPRGKVSFNEKKPYIDFSVSRADAIHLHRKKLSLWYNGSTNENGQESRCLHCHKLNTEISTYGSVTDYRGRNLTERILPITTYSYDTGSCCYVADDAFKHRCLVEADDEEVDDEDYGDLIPYYKTSHICWRFFASKCAFCGFKVARVRGDREYKKNLTELECLSFRDDCLACYYFTYVLNELMDFTEQRYDRIFGLDHRLITRKQWPLRRVNKIVCIMALIFSVRRMNIIIPRILIEQIMTYGAK